MLAEGSNFCKVKEKKHFTIIDQVHLSSLCLRFLLALLVNLYICVRHFVVLLFFISMPLSNMQLTLDTLFKCCPSRLDLYNAENLIVAQMLSLTVDKEVVKLRDSQPQDTQRHVFYSCPVGHNAGCCNGI